MSAELDNVIPSWADIRLKVDGKELVGFTSVSFGDKIEDELVYGQGRIPRGRTRGKYTVDDGSISVHHDTLVEILDAFGDGWGDKRFEIVEQITLGDGSVSTTVVENCRWKGAPGGGEEGTSAIVRELPFGYLRIRRDGKYLIAERR